MTQVPEWDTPQAWDEAEEVVRSAGVFYKSRADDLIKHHFGHFIVIDSETGESVIATDEVAADGEFRSKYGVERKSALFHIGFF